MRTSRVAGCRSWRDARRSRAQGGAAWSRFARVLARPSVAAHPARRAGRRPRGVAPAHPPGARSRPRHRRRAAFHGIAAVCAATTAYGPSAAGHLARRTGKKSTSKADNALEGAFEHVRADVSHERRREFHARKIPLPAIDPGCRKARRTDAPSPRRCATLTRSRWRKGTQSSKTAAVRAIPRRGHPVRGPVVGRGAAWQHCPEGRGFRLRGVHERTAKKCPSFASVRRGAGFAPPRDAQTLDMGDIIYGGEIGESNHGCPTVYIANLMLSRLPAGQPSAGSHDRKKRAGPYAPQPAAPGSVRA